MIVLRIGFSAIAGTGLASGALAGWLNARFASAADAPAVQLVTLFFLLFGFVAATGTTLRRAMRVARLSGYAVRKFRKRLHQSVTMTRVDGNQTPAPRKDAGEAGNSARRLR